MAFCVFENVAFYVCSRCRYKNELRFESRERLPRHHRTILTLAIQDNTTCGDCGTSLTKSFWLCRNGHVNTIEFMPTPSAHPMYRCLECGVMRTVMESCSRVQRPCDVVRILCGDDLGGWLPDLARIVGQFVSPEDLMVRDSGGYWYDAAIV